MFIRVREENMQCVYACKHVSTSSRLQRIYDVYIDICPYGHFPGRVFARYLALYMYIRFTSANDPCLHIYIKYNTYTERRAREREGDVRA